MGNLPNATLYIQNPIDWRNGFVSLIHSNVAEDYGINEARKQSSFMNRRYMGDSIDKITKDVQQNKLSEKPKEFAIWMLGAGDRAAAELIWHTAYTQALRNPNVLFDGVNKLRNYQSRDYSSGEAFVRSGLSDTEKRLHDGGYSESEIEAIENAFKGGRNKGESINYIESKLGFTEAEAFEAYSRRKGEWINELSGEDAKRAQGAADYYGMSTEEYKTVLNLSKFGAQIKKADGPEEYSTSAENVIPNIAKALGVTEKRAEELYNRVTKYEYVKSDLEPERVKDLETSAKWYGVDEKGYFVARNAIKTAEGEKDKYGKTISGTEKAAAIKEISSMLGIDTQEAAVYYLAAKGELVLSKEDLTSAKRADLEEAMKHGWSELQFFDAVNVIKLSGASKKDDIIRALQDAGATYEMAVGYYNLTKNYDYYKRS